METFLDLLAGNLSPSQRVWTALAPSLVFIGYFVFGFIAYTIRYWIKGPYQDPEMQARPTTLLMGMWIRLCFAWLMKPLWSAAIRSGLPANAITTLSVLLSTGAGVSLAAGRFALGGWLYIFSGILDVLDGRMARARGRASASGAALDSILDRYSDAAVLMGLAWYYRDSWVLMAVLTALVGSSLVPYIRAKAEASGISMREVGMMQRAERIVYLGAAVALSPIVEVLVHPDEKYPMHWLAVGGVVLLAVSTQITALQRFGALLSALGDSVFKASWMRTGKGSALRNVVAALVATGFDFLFLLALVFSGYFAPPIATAIGCGVGAVINFSVNRIWTFGSNDAKLPQMGRYAFVSFTSALLNAGGVAVMLLLPSIDYRVAWVIVRAAVFLMWNFPLHRDYVFVGEAREEPPEPKLEAGRA